MKLRYTKKDVQKALNCAQKALYIPHYNNKGEQDDVLISRNFIEWKLKEIYQNKFGKVK